MRKYDDKDILYHSFKFFFKTLLIDYKKNLSILKKNSNRELFFKSIVYKIINNNYFMNNYYLYELSKEKKKKIFGDIKNKFQIDSGYISFSDNKLIISNLFVFKKIIRSLFIVIRNVFILLINFFNLKKTHKEFIVIFSKFAKQDRFDQLKIKSFFSEKTIKLFENKNIIFMNEKHKNFDRYYFSKEPILYLAKNFLDNSAKIILIGRLIKVYIRYILLIRSFKPIILLIDDLIEREIVNFLSEKKISNKYFITNSSAMGNLKIWMDNSNKNIETHCYWDSVSVLYPIKTKDRNIKINILNSFMNFTNHYAWNLKCKKFLGRYFKNSNLFNINPMNLYFTNKKHELIKKDFNIGIFDTENLPSMLVGNQLCESFKNNKSLKNFYTDILDIVREIEKEHKINIQVFIKRKHNHQNTSKKFISNIRDFNLIDHDAELPFLFKDLDTVICMPYTTVGFHFSELEKKLSFFYDGDSIIKEYKLPKNIFLINNKTKLKNELLGVYKIKKKN